MTNARATSRAERAWLREVLGSDDDRPHRRARTTEEGACARCGTTGRVRPRRSVFGDGPVTGTTVLVHGVLGGVGTHAAQLATWGGATVTGTVRRSKDLGRVPQQAVAHAIALHQPSPAAAIRDLASGGVDRIVEVSLSDNVDLDAAVAKVGTVIATCATREDRPSLPFWPMLFDNATIRLLGSDDFPAAAEQQTAADLTIAARDGGLSLAIGRPLSLASAAEAHERVDAGSRERVLLVIDD